MVQKEYWELYITQGKKKIWLKTYADSRTKCLDDIIKIAQAIKGVKHIHIHEHWDTEFSVYDFGSHTTFFEIKRVVKNEDS